MIRRFLFDLLAPRNFNDVAYHLNSFLPNFLQKIERVINESDRDADFRSLAEDFDRVKGDLIEDHFLQTRSLFQKILKDTLSKIRADTSAYQRQIDDKLENELCKYRSPTFNKIMKARGNLPPKSSKAKGLENGCSLNRDFSTIIAPAFLKWDFTYSERMQPMRQALIQLTAVMGHAVLSILNSSSANVMVVERAKQHWKQHRKDLRVKMELLMEDFEKLQAKALVKATMDDGQQNCLVATITDEHFDAVYQAQLPQDLASLPAKQRQTRIKYQKMMLTERFSGSIGHFVNDVLRTFHERLSRDINALLERHFPELRNQLDHYSTCLKGEAPISYKVEQPGLDIRADIERVFPELRNIVADLQREFPQQQNNQDDGSLYLPDIDGASNLLAIYGQLCKKRKQGVQENAKVKVKKEKQ